MKATLPFVLETFEKFNALCFEGSLPPIPVKLTAAGTFLGKVTYVGRRNLLGRVSKYENYTMRISTLFDLPAKELEDVVIHEMIHYYIALKGIRDTSVHGTVFRSMMENINSRFGRNISVRHNAASSQVSAKTEQIRANWLCVTQLENGEWGVTSCAKTRIFELYRALPKYFRLKSMAWYGSFDPFFNRFPRSQKPSIYKISREELDKHLSDAQPLQCDGRRIHPV